MRVLRSFRSILSYELNVRQEIRFVVGFQKSHVDLRALVKLFHLGSEVGVWIWLDVAVHTHRYGQGSRRAGEQEKKDQVQIVQIFLPCLLCLPCLPCGLINTRSVQLHSSALQPF